MECAQLQIAGIEVGALSTTISFCGRLRAASFRCMRMRFFRWVRTVLTTQTLRLATGQAICA
jgi:hypothetical protein